MTFTSLEDKFPQVSTQPPAPVLYADQCGGCLRASLPSLQNKNPFPPAPSALPHLKSGMATVQTVTTDTIPVELSYGYQHSSV